jgi:hypothetical protein
VDVFRLLETWVRRHAGDLEGNGLTPSLIWDDGSATFDVDAPTRSARLTITPDGEAVIDRAEWSSDLLMIPEQRTLASPEELEEALTTVVEWASTGG